MNRQRYELSEIVNERDKRIEYMTERRISKMSCFVLLYSKFDEYFNSRIRDKNSIRKGIEYLKKPLHFLSYHMYKFGRSLPHGEA